MFQLIPTLIQTNTKFFHKAHFQVITHLNRMLLVVILPVIAPAATVLIPAVMLLLLLVVVWVVGRGGVSVVHTELVAVVVLVVRH